MNTEFEHVNGQAKFYGEANAIILDYQRTKIEVLTSVDIENTILSRLTDAAALFVAPDAVHDEVKKAVALVYMSHRPGLPMTKTPELFFRTSHLHSLVLNIIDSVAALPAATVAKGKKGKASKALTQPKKKEESAATTQTAVSGPPPPDGSPVGAFLDGQGGDQGDPS